MELEHSFTVPADIETAWQTLLDIDRVALCMPGATLTSHEGDAFKGEVKVKLGPVSMVYGGTATFAEKDAATHHVVIKASGSETKGTGTAQATVHAQLISESANQTRVEVKTDLAITGKPAQFGRGVMQDVASRIIGQFATNLGSLISESQADPNFPPESPSPAPLPPQSMNIMSVLAGPVLKRLIPVLLVVILLIWWFTGR
jgi:carbon monoxide dehydrogenase subunit G